MCCAAITLQEAVLYASTEIAVAAIVLGVGLIPFAVLVVDKLLVAAVFLVLINTFGNYNV